MAKVLESFSDIEDIINLLKLPDFEGRDCFWYLQQFPLFSVLEVKIMDKFIRQKWDGASEVNCSMLSYSASYQILTDKHNTYMTENLLKRLSN